jgi:predicted RNase H-like HicB family nuclease
MKYTICLRYEDSSYAAWCPGLPGCWSEGATKEEAITNIREAIREYLEVAEILASNEEHYSVEIA